MQVSGDEIFRCMDHFHCSSIEESIRQLESHLKYGILSPSEQKIKGIVGGKIMNLINQNYISVYGGKINDKIHTMIKNIDLGIFGCDGSRTSLGIIINSPYKPNDHTPKPGTIHHVIDATEVPVQDRKITGIVVNISKFNYEELEIVIMLGKKYKLPVYKVEKKFINNDIAVELIELRTKNSTS